VLSAADRSLDAGGLNRIQFFHLYDRFDARKRVFDIPINQAII